LALSRALGYQGSVGTSFDIASAMASLDVAEERIVPDLGWLRASWEEPETFWKALAAHAGRIAGPLTSQPGIVYDLYSDSVTRHAAAPRVACLSYDRRAGWTALSYAEVDATATGLAATWAAHGAAPGAVIALLLPPGPDAIIAMAAALRLGACLSWAPPLGDLALSARLKAAKPAHVVFDPRRPPAGLGELSEKALPFEPGARALGPSIRPRAAALPPHGYAHGEPCAAVFSWTRSPPHQPTLVPAEAAFLRPLRDGLLAFRLLPGDCLAAPGAHPAQHLPALVLTTLLAGATFVDIPFEDVAKTPEILLEQPITSLLVPSALAEVLRRRPIGALPALRGLLRPVDEPLDWTAQRDFLTRNGLTEIPFGNVLLDSAGAGCTLFSARRPGSPSAKVLPSAGVPWKLFTPGSDRPAAGDSGVFVPMPSEAPAKDGYFVLARTGEEHLYGLTLEPRRAARVFPSDEVIAAAAGLPFVEGAGVVPLPGAGPAGGALFVLCLFTGGRPAPPSFVDVVRQTLSTRLGPDFAPDLIELFPLHPRRVDGKVDAAWCTSHYISGRLHARAADPLFRDLSRLRRALSAS
jgi:hypothetical protein